MHAVIPIVHGLCPQPCAGSRSPIPSSQRSAYPVQPVQPPHSQRHEHPRPYIFRQLPTVGHCAPIRGVVCANDDLTGDPRVPYRAVCHWPIAAHVHGRGQTADQGGPFPKPRTSNDPHPKQSSVSEALKSAQLERVEPYIQSLPSLDVCVYQSTAHEETRK